MPGRRYAVGMEQYDLDLSLATLDRLEAERRLRSIPPGLLESAWALDAQTEAVIDALLAATASEDRACAHARHVGEWAARIATALPYGPPPVYMRRCGVLADVDPAILERVREVREYAPVVRAFQRLRIAGEGPEEVRTAALIIAAADEFDSLIFDCDKEHRRSPSGALHFMRRCTNEESRRIVDALIQSARSEAHDLPEIA